MDDTPFSALVLLTVTATVLTTAQSLPTLRTTYGDVTGLEKFMFKRDIQVFYGIPFAKPPNGERRFRAPEQVDAWDAEAIDGTTKPPACWQSIDTAFDRFEGIEMWNPNTRMDEDCLYLNIWRRKPEQGDSPKTIMVWIHGGGFSSGSSVLDIYDGSQLAARENVVVVTIAYRLGPLGFMYLDNDGEVTGNAGLLDQVMALQWVKDNARSLGGSPDDITIFGEDAGAVSVGFHLLSPLSRDLFTNAIMQSGSPLSNWALRDTQDAEVRVNKLAEKVDCPDSSNGDLLDCLRAVDPERLTEKQWDLKDKWFDVPIGPIIDGDFLAYHPEVMLSAGDVKRTNLIIGVNLNEGIIQAAHEFPADFSIYGDGGMSDQARFREIMLTIANNNRTTQTELLSFYSQEFNDANNRRMRIVDAAIGDSLFKCSVLDFARQYTRELGSVYLYSFEQKFSTNPWPGWMAVPHGYEIEVVFGQPLSKFSENSDAEKELTKEVMQRWTNFSRKG